MGAAGNALRSAIAGLCALRRRSARLLSADDWVYLVALCLPTLVLDLVLAWHQAMSGFSAPARRQALIAIPAEFLVHLGVAGLWMLVFALTPSRWRRRLRLLAFHGFVAAYLVFTLAAALYFDQTGSVLDGGTLLAASSSPAIASALVGRSIDPAHLVLAAAVAGYALAGPFLLVRLRRWLLRHQTLRDPMVRNPIVRDGRPTHPNGASTAGLYRHRRALICAGAVLVLAVGSAVPDVTGAGSMSRNRAIDIAWDLLGTARQASAARADGTTLAETTLVRTSTGREDPRNLVVIVLESLRASAATLDDPELPTTPFLAELAQRSTVARNAYTVVPHTSKAITAVHCGIAPPLDTRLSESEPGGIPSTCLPELLGREGYATGFFQSAVGEFERRPELVRNLGFDEFRPVEDLPQEGFGRANYFGFEDDILLGPSSDWIKQQTQPFLLSLLTVASHHDYKLPDTFALRHLSDDEELNLYLNTAAYQDRFVSKVFDLLEDAGVADDTVVAVVADHGEGFGEHGLRQHDNTIYNEGIKVPMMVFDPSDPVGRTVDEPVTTMSVVPTVLDAMGYRLSGGLSTAPSLSDARSARSAQTAPAAPVYVSCQADNRCVARIEGTTKYVHHFGNRPDELFNLADDPGEQENIIGTLSRAQQHQLQQELLAWRSEVRLDYVRARSRR